MRITAFCLSALMALAAGGVLAAPAMQVDLSVSAGDADTQAKLQGCLVTELMKIPDLAIGAQRPHFRIRAAAVFDQVELVSISTVSTTLIKPVWLAEEYLEPPVALERRTDRGLKMLVGPDYRSELEGLGHLTSHQLQVVPPEELAQVCAELISNFDQMTVAPVRRYMQEMQSKHHLQASPPPAGTWSQPADPAAAGRAGGMAPAHHSTFAPRVPAGMPMPEETPVPQIMIEAPLLETPAGPPQAGATPVPQITIEAPVSETPAELPQPAATPAPQGMIKAPEIETPAALSQPEATAAPQLEAEAPAVETPAEASVESAQPAATEPAAASSAVGQDATGPAMAPEAEAEPSQAATVAETTPDEAAAL